MSKINLIPEVTADWEGMLRVVTRITYALIAVNVAVIVWIIATNI